MITPLHKIGPLDDVNNFRPISLLISFSKILETIVTLKVTSYLDQYNLLSDYQFGFRGGKSTSDAVSSFFQQLQSIYSYGQHALGVFCDLSKAFDSVNHNILKLPFYGITNDALSFYFTEITSHESEILKINFT